MFAVTRLLAAMDLFSAALVRLASLANGAADAIESKQPVEVPAIETEGKRKR